MLLSISLIIIISLLLGKIFNLLKLPSILGMLLTGILMGPYLLNLIDNNVLNISTELRQIALIVILIRAGLSLNIKDLKKVGKPAILLSFLPATIEVIVITFLAPLFFDISYVTALIMGSIVAAVSPAVVVPKMISLIDKGYGQNKKIPQMILASASMDDVFVIVLFYSFLKLGQGESFSFSTLINIPVSIVTGIGIGALVGFLLSLFFKKLHMRDTVKVLIIFALGFLFVTLENTLGKIIAISGLIAVMSFGISLNNFYPILSKRLVIKFEKIWVIAEIMLFVLVGALVDVRVLFDLGLLTIVLVVISMIFRISGVYLSLIHTSLNNKEKLFTAVSYLPKATVQAAIGAIPLSLGIENGELILMVSVLAIIITAPIGAILMDKTYKTLLVKTEDIVITEI
ncbi:MAG: cation:proton antiporter [Bacilli bacterium]|jgi:NhaP-type Na+/H+ or K+/H+ antiporter|nr:cation:proton antiporter [Bacilli bacterium]MDY0363668.1 cation:proton antiporter [Bacilli bacterium]